MNKLDVNKRASDGNDIAQWRRFWRQKTAHVVEQPLQRHFSVARAKKCVLIIETRTFDKQLPHMRAIVHQSLAHVPLDYAVLFLCSNDNRDGVEQLVRLLNCNAEWRLLDTPLDDVNHYNNLLLSAAFWQPFAGKLVLLLQEDSVLLADGLQRFEQYDLVGAAWPRSLQIAPASVGNGGLCLRRVDSMLQCLKSTPPASSGLKVAAAVQRNMRERNLAQIPEDVYFSSVLPSVAPYDVATTFAVESVFGRQDPLGYHQPWRCGGDQRRWRAHIDRALRATPRQTFFFCHIEKCGGSTLRRIVYNAFTDHTRDDGVARCFIPGVTTSNKATIDLTSNDDYDVYAYHVDYYHFCRTIGARKTNLFCVTLLREPVQRLISHYHAFDQSKYDRRRLDQLTETELSRYCDTIGHLMLRRLGTIATTAEQSDCHHGGMKDMYRNACSALQQMRLVGFVEHMGEFCSALSQLTARPFNPIEPINVAHNKPHYDDAFLKTLGEKLYWEQRLFDHAVGLFKKK